MPAATLAEAALQAPAAALPAARGAGGSARAMRTSTVPRGHEHDPDQQLKQRKKRPKKTNLRKKKLRKKRLRK